MSLHPVDVLARSSGALAMLAVDQREALRVMTAQARGCAVEAVSDGDLTQFKLMATEVLSPYASAVLVDHQFAWQPLVDAGVTARTCALISSADHFVPSEREIVADAVIDRTVDFDRVREQGAVAAKLLVVWRQEGDPGVRRERVTEFVRLARSAGLVSIIEPVTRAPRAGGRWDREEDIVAAAVELGQLGAEVYKAEVPTFGHGTDGEIDKYCRRISEAVAGGDWVVLSSGVEADRFPETVRIACRAGARGFLAGRAVWASVVGASDLRERLENEALPRLQRLCAVVDDAVTSRAS